MSKTASSSLSTNSLAEITKVIETLLEYNPLTKQQANSVLETARQKDFNEYINSITTILKENPQVTIKVFCLAHLRRLLSFYIQEEEKGWIDLQPGVQKLVKETLLEMLKDDSYPGAKFLLNEFIGDLACTIQAAGGLGKRLSKEATEWNELKQVLSESFTSGNTMLIKSALLCLATILHGEYEFIAKNDKQIMDMLKSLMKNSNDNSVKMRALSQIAKMVDTFPKKFAKKSSDIKEIVELIFNFMISFTEEPSADWLDPPVDLLETDPDPASERMTICLSFLDTIVATSKPALTMAHQVISEMINVKDWRYAYCSVMCLSQLAEFTDDLSGFDFIVAAIVIFLKHEHPKVRFAALHCIGQCAEDARPEFQERYGQNLLSLIIKACKDDCPRVVGHAVSCHVNFIHGCPQEILNPVTPQIAEIMIEFVEKSKGEAKENATSALANLAEECWEAFKPYFNKAYNAILGELKNASDYQKTFKGFAVEAATILARAAGREEFVKVCEPLIVTMLKIQQNQLASPKLDALSTSLVHSWARVCLVLKEDFEPYATSVMSSAFSLAENMCDAQKKREDELLGFEDEVAIVAKNIGPGGEEIKSLDDDKIFFEKDETPVAQDTTAIMNMLVEFFKCGFKEESVEYVESALQIITLIILDNEDTNVNRVAVAALKDIINVIDQSNYEGKQTILTNLSFIWLETLIDDNTLDLDSTCKMSFFDGMTEFIFKAGKVMTDAQLNTVMNCAFKSLKESQQALLTLAETNEGDNEDEDDEDEEGEDGAEEKEKDPPYKVEENLQGVIADLVGALFKVYKEKTLPFVQLVKTEVLSKGLKPDVPPTLTRTALFFIDNLIEFLGVEYITEDLPQMAQTLIKYTTYCNSALRNAAVYGLGILSESGAEMFKDVLEDCLKAMYDSLLLKKDDDDSPFDFEHCNDNVISTIGKIIKNHQHNLANLNKAFQVWLGHLPLKVDKAEGRIQHDQLVDMLLGPDAALVLGENNENLQKIVQIVGEVIGTKLVNNEFDRKAVEAIGFLNGNETTKVLVEQAISSLPVKTKNKLKAALQGSS